jgi:hypothetical protein
MGRRRHGFRHNERGGVAIFFGFALPVLLVGAGAALEYASLTQRRAQLQRAAGTAALTAARELSLANADDTRVNSVAKAAALASLSTGKQDGSSASVASQILEKRSGVEVTIAETVTNIMGKVLSLPSSELRVRAGAKLTGGGRLCVLALDPSASAAIRLDASSKLTANGCSVQSNSTSQKSIQARDYSFLLAEKICSAGGYDGRTGVNISPAPVTDCPQISDPLANRPPLPILGRLRARLFLEPAPAADDQRRAAADPRSWRLLRRARHHQERDGDPREGTYVMNQGPLIVEKGSTLIGDYVGFYFNGDLATLKFDFDSTVSLSAPKIGAMAGLLFYSDPKAVLGNKFRIYSDNARKLLGTIYLPRSGLYVDANKPVADQSAYTVIVARSIELNSGPNLVLNANYGSTDVPVPQGGGPIGATVTLAQ